MWKIANKYWESVLTEYIMIYFNGESYLPKWMEEDQTVYEEGE